MKEKVKIVLNAVKYSPKTTEELSNLGIKNLRKFLQRMVWLGFLKKENSKYRITEKGALFLKNPSFFFVEPFKPERLYHALRFLFVRDGKINTVISLPTSVFSEFLSIYTLRAYVLLGFLSFRKEKRRKKYCYAFKLTKQGLDFLKDYNPSLRTYKVFQQII